MPHGKLYERLAKQDLSEIPFEVHEAPANFKVIAFFAGIAFCLAGILVGSVFLSMALLPVAP